MTTLREAAQMALDALDKLLDKLNADICDNSGIWDEYCDGGNAMQALSAALAQPKQEPVAWVYPDGFEALQNRKCWTAYGTHQNEMMRPLYAAPPQREWQGLTDEDMRKLSDDCAGVRDENEFIRAIEAKLKEKNT